MSIRILIMLLLVVQLAIGLAALVVLITFVGQAIEGGPFTVAWPVAARAAVASFPLANDMGALHIDRGTLVFAGMDWKPAFAQTVALAIFTVGANVAIERLKAILNAIAAGRPFDGDVVRGLRMIGWLAIGWSLLDMVIAAIGQALLLSTARLADGAAVLGGHWSWRDGAERSRTFLLDYEFDLMTLCAGLFALALAQAFAVGRRLADDNAAIV